MTATNKKEVMQKFGFTNADEFDTLLLDLDIDPDLPELNKQQVEQVKNHVTVFVTSLTALPAVEEASNGNGNGHQTYTPPSDAMSVITNQGLQLAKEAGLQINRGAIETLCQSNFNKGRLDAAWLENAYWLGLLRQQNQLRAANTQKYMQLMDVQQNTNLDIEKLAADAGLTSNEELLGKLSKEAASVTNTANLTSAIADSTNW